MLSNLVSKNERAEKQLRLRHQHMVEWQSQLATEAQTRRDMEDKHQQEIKQLRVQAFLFSDQSRLIQQQLQELADWRNENQFIRQAIRDRQRQEISTLE